MTDLNKESSETTDDEEIILKVIWTDSCSPDFGWCHMSDIITEEFLVETVGILIDENEDAITLAMSRGMEDPQKINNPFVIPICCIRHRIEL